MKRQAITRIGILALPGPPMESDLHSCPEKAAIWTSGLFPLKVERRFTHPLMGKTVRRSKKYHAHDEAGEFKSGDVVRIRECKPISKQKCWEVVGLAGKE